MRIPGWRPTAHAVSVPQIDAEHQALFQLCADLNRALGKDADDERIQALLNELLFHAAEHFRHEERRMRSGGYPLYGWHRRQHHTAVVRARLLERHIQRGEQEESLESLRAFSKWLDDHIRLADRMWGAYFRNREREMAALAAQ